MKSKFGADLPNPKQAWVEPGSEERVCEAWQICLPGFGSDAAVRPGLTESGLTEFGLMDLARGSTGFELRVGFGAGLEPGRLASGARLCPS